MLSPVAWTLAKEHGIRHAPVRYPASIAPAGGLKMFHESVAEGKANAIAADAEGQPSIWVGYSLGALILGDLLAQSKLKNCIGAILLSDPKRHPRQIATECMVSDHLSGCAGSRFIPDSAAKPVIQISIPDDPISALPRGNGFRVISDAVTGYSQEWKLGYADLLSVANAVSRYTGTPPIGDAPARGSRHVSYGIEDMPYFLSKTTYVEFAAQLANEIANSHVYGGEA